MALGTIDSCCIRSTQCRKLSPQSLQPGDDARVIDTTVSLLLPLATVLSIIRKKKKKRLGATWKNRDGPKHSNDKVVRGKTINTIVNLEHPSSDGPKGKKAAETYLAQIAKTVPGKGTHPGPVPSVALLSGHDMHTCAGCCCGRAHLCS